MKRREATKHGKTLRDQKWIDEAPSSGPEQSFKWSKLRAAFRKGLRRAKNA